MRIDPAMRSEVGGESDAKDDLGGKAGGAESASNGAERITEEISRDSVRSHIENRAEGIELEKISQSHFHASGERRRHGVDARDELGEKQCLLAAPVKIFGRAENASFRIRRKPAQKAEQCPSTDSAHEIKNDVAEDHRQHAYADYEIQM